MSNEPMVNEGLLAGRVYFSPSYKPAPEGKAMITLQRVEVEAALGGTLDHKAVRPGRNRRPKSPIVWRAVIAVTDNEILGVANEILGLWAYRSIVAGADRFPS